MLKLALGKKEIARKLGQEEEYKSLVNRKYSLKDLKYNETAEMCNKQGKGIVLLFFKKGKGRMKS